MLYCTIYPTIEDLSRRATFYLSYVVSGRLLMYDCLHPFALCRSSMCIVQLASQVSRFLDLDHRIGAQVPIQLDI